MRAPQTLLPALLALGLLPLTSGTSPANPFTGKTPDLLPLAATLPPNSTAASCPGTTSSCPTAPGVCCPSRTTCLKKQDVSGVRGWGCCANALPGATCAIVLSNQECAVDGWVVCAGGGGGSKGKGKSGEGPGTTCCLRREMCRYVERGEWDCGGEGEGSGNATSTAAATDTATWTSLTTKTTATETASSGAAAATQVLGIGAGMLLAAVGWWVV